MNSQFYTAPPSVVEKLLSISPAEKLAAAVFNLAISPEMTAISEDGTSITYSGTRFNYDLGEMYRASAARTGEYNLTIYKAGDEGEPLDITVDTVEVAGQRGIVTCAIYQPTSYYGEDWICSGTLQLILTDAENQDSLLKAEVARVKVMVRSLVARLAVDLLRSAASGEDLGELVKDVLTDLASDARYEFCKDDGRIYSCGDIASAKAVAEASDAVSNLLDGSYAGACIVEVLTRHPLVESFTLEFTTSQEYSDGSYYTAKNVNVIDLAFVEDSENEELDPDEYADDVLDGIRDRSVETDLYDGLVGREPSEDLDVKVSRTALKHLLEADKIDGLAVATLVLETASEA